MSWGDVPVRLTGRGGWIYGCPRAVGNAAVDDEVRQRGGSGWRPVCSRMMSWSCCGGSRRALGRSARSLGLDQVRARHRLADRREAVRVLPAELAGRRAQGVRRAATHDLRRLLSRGRDLPAQDRPAAQQGRVPALPAPQFAVRARGRHPPPPPGPADRAGMVPDPADELSRHVDDGVLRAGDQADAGRGPCHRRRASGAYLPSALGERELLRHDRGGGRHRARQARPGRVPAAAAPSASCGMRGCQR